MKTKIMKLKAQQNKSGHVHTKRQETQRYNYLCLPFFHIYYIIIFAELTCRFDGLPSYCDLHGRAHQDPDGVVLRVQQLVPRFMTVTKEKTSR